MSKSNASVEGPRFEEHLVCPFDGLHRILPLDMKTHVLQCAKNFPLEKLVHCPYNCGQIHSVAEMEVSTKLVNLLIK